jgi:hypothetical protein
MNSWKNLLFSYYKKIASERSYENHINKLKAKNVDEIFFFLMLSSCVKKVF